MRDPRETAADWGRDASLVGMDVLYVLLTVGVFVVLGLVVRGVEKL